MNISQAEQVVKFVAQAAPAQKLNDGTAAVWHAILGDIRFADAIEACGRIARRQAWIAPADIIAEVKVIKDDRVDRIEMPVPNANPDDPVAYAAEYRAVRAAIRDGDLDGERLDAYRRGEVSLTGRPALAGPLSDPNPETGSAILREFLDAKRRADAQREAARAAALRDEEAERARQLAAIAERIATEEADASDRGVA